MDLTSLCREAETFFLRLQQNEEGRHLLREHRFDFHFSLGDQQGLILRFAEGTVRAEAAPPQIEFNPRLTRFFVNNAETLTDLFAGVRTFTEAVIPLGPEDRSIQFRDNWMAKKIPINWLGRMIRCAQELRG